MGNTKAWLDNQMTSLLPRIAPVVTATAETATCHGWASCTHYVCLYQHPNQNRVVSCYTCNGFTSCWEAGCCPQ